MVFTWKTAQHSGTKSLIQGISGVDYNTEEQLHPFEVIQQLAKSSCSIQCTPNNSKYNTDYCTFTLTRVPYSYTYVTLHILRLTNLCLVGQDTSMRSEGRTKANKVYY